MSMTKEAIAARVEELLSRMTLEEKAAQMVQVPLNMVGKEEALRWAKLGAGSFLHVLGDDARDIQQAALSSRLGIPVIFGIDAIHGHAFNRNATVFPSQLTAACSWDPEIARTMGRVTATETATDGLHWTFSPVLCLGRDTRWGRVDETFGEDAYLAGELGAAIIEGYQGEDLAADDSILACAKHYLAYGEATGARDAIDSEVTERKIREVFLRPFQRAAEVGCATFMTAYGSIDGLPLTVNRRMLTEILRDELGFDGFVVTDWDNAGGLVSRQHVAETNEEAALMAAAAGNDMIMSTLEYYEAAVAAVKNGTMPESVLDNAVRRILSVKVRMGLFEKPDKIGRPGSIGCKEHLEAALTAARASVTLLRNNGVLPLKNTVKKIAVIGPAADDLRVQYGDWTYFTHPDPDPEFTRTAQRPYVTTREGFEAICRERGIELVYAQGCGIESGESIAEAVKAAEGADAVFLCLGDNSHLFGEYKDRADLALSGKQSELFAALKAAGNTVITVFIASKPLCLGDAAEGADAVICGFNGGMFGGQAIAEAAFGLLNPQGRLPISFPRHSGQLPVYYNSMPGWHGDKYEDLPATPLFAFGEGMGYAPFTYANLQVADDLTLTVDVTNAGAVEGTEVVQVYMRDVVSSIITPVKNLIAFTRVTLAPGETRTVRIALKRDDFALINTRCEKVVEPGKFIVFAGHSSKDEDLQSVTITL